MRHKILTHQSIHIGTYEELILYQGKPAVQWTKRELNELKWDNKSRDVVFETWLAAFFHGSWTTFDLQVTVNGFSNKCRVSTTFWCCQQRNDRR